MIDVSSKKRIVLKLGTSTLTHKTGKLNIRRMTNLVRILSDLHNAGKELLLVSSGAVGMGVGKLNQGHALQTGCRRSGTVRTDAHLRRHVFQI